MILRFIVFALVGVAGAYQLVALLAAVVRLRRRASPSSFTPAVSFLKPVRGADPGFYDAIRSNAAQDYPDFEMLFGGIDRADPARAVVQGLADDFPERPIRWMTTSRKMPNGKVGVLADLAERATAPILLVSDSDILVPPEYLRRVVAPLEDPKVGLVTCAYRARAATWPARFEAIGVATDFGPSTMMAQLVGVNEFALGATLVFRAADLERIGGFAAIGDYLADDYQIGHRIHALGLRCVLSEVVVETHLDARTWGDVWRHQLRWARTIRVSRGGGYVGLPITNASLWVVVAAACGLWIPAAFLMALRFAMAFVAGYGALGSRDVLRYFYLIPLRDLFAAAIWVAGLFGDTVDWGGQKLRLSKDGRIVP